MISEIQCQWMYSTWFACVFDGFDWSALVQTRYFCGLWKFYSISTEKFMASPHPSMSPHSTYMNSNNYMSWNKFVNNRAKIIFESNYLIAFKSKLILTLILRRSRTRTVWFYTSTSNKRAARPKLYTKSLTRDLKRMYSRLTLVRISINL